MHCQIYLTLGEKVQIKLKPHVHSLPPLTKLWQKLKQEHNLTLLLQTQK